MQETVESDRTRSWPRAFSHPLWWCALGLLLLNDQLLKHCRLLPGSVTGKLSDFAGLVVAPPLVAFVLGARRLRSRALATACVAAGFGLIKLVPTAALGFERALNAVGIPARVCLDPTDLWALLVLPLAYRMCIPALARPASACSSAAGLDFTRRVGLALAAFACVATSGFGGGADKRSDAPQVENSTSSPLALIVSSTDGAGGCSLYRDDRIALLTADAFTSPRTVTLDPGERATLPANTATTSCGAASIALPDGTATRLFWRDLKEIASFVPADDARRAARLVAIQGKTDAFKTDLGDDLHALEPDSSLPDPNCKPVDPEFTLEATALGHASGFLELGEVRTDQDNCIEADWFETEGDTTPDTQRLCIPDWAFPFEARQTLSVIQALGQDGERTLHIAQFSGSTLKLELVIWNDAATFEGGHIKSAAATDCIGTLTACGAYVRPATLTVSGKGTNLAPGGDVTLKASAPKQTRLLVGSARHVAWTGATCSGAEARVGLSANVLELRTY